MKYFRIRTTTHNASGQWSGMRIIKADSHKTTFDILDEEVARLLKDGTEESSPPKVEVIFLGNGEPMIPARYGHRKFHTQRQALSYESGYEGYEPLFMDREPIDSFYSEGAHDREAEDQAREEARHEAREQRHS